MRILVADAEREFREMLAEYLAPHGFEIIEAADGLETLLRVKRVPLAAVVLDLRMPRLGGIEAIKRIHAFSLTLPGIVVTAALEPELHHQARAVGARAVFQKPVALPNLLATLRSHAVEVHASEDAVTARIDPPRPPSARSTAAQVLVVDDDPDVRELLVDFVRHHGYRTSTARDAATAIRALVQTSADIVLLDIGLPGLSGVDALPPIRAVAPQAASSW